MSQPRVAVVGCGYWGKNLVRNFARLQALDLLCDENPDTLKKVAALYPGLRTTTDFNDVLDDDAVGAVVLATPAAAHHEHVGRALRAGKDVFVEKPLALRYAEGVEFVELAAKLERIVMVGHILEYHPAVEILRGLVRGGELGRLWYVYSNRANLGKVRKEENILWSFAPHDISLICSLAGADPTTVAAAGGSYLQDDIADVTTTMMSFEDGMRAHIFVSWLHPYKEQRLVVIGDRKMAVFDDQKKEDKLKIYDKGIEWREGQPVPRQTSETTLFFAESEPMERECMHFLHCVEHRERPLTDGESAARVLKVLEASQLSLERSGEPVALADVVGAMRR